ncbi:6-phosphogluconolactonase [Maribacter algarum]|uniref:6-phosphogluconolactonase n=1 Tax=Maribacter algarum (ex Zhang et al. 2020) TaxID=2578118 RepID=A0A5S3PMP0_9FLAO|nr:6-phosphogluconolactonase [Maribacter algarum]TMM53686.1 6-phosphogluconolactonase [Maribacter algarum]
MKLKISKTKQEVALNFSRYLAILIANMEEVHIALSGGSTPKIVFDELAANFQTDIDWSGVHLYWGDERCVEPTAEQSNYRMTLEHLISKITIPEENIHRIKGENEPEYEAKRYGAFLEENLPKTNGLPKFDLVILGMGDDGHTASIFPHEIKLWHSEKYCEVAVHADSGQKRVSLTGQVINNADTVVFLVTGESKAEKFKEIKNKSGAYEDYPASLVNPSSGRLLWFLDESAAGITSTQS